MGYLALFVLAVLGHMVTAKSWGGYYNFHWPMRDYHHPARSHQNFNYNTWCHSAGGWDSNQSWENSQSNESSEENGDQSRPLSAGGWNYKDSWERISSEESREWDDYNIPISRRVRESSENISSEETHEQIDDTDILLSLTTTRRSVIINKTQTEGTSSVLIRQTSTDSKPSLLEIVMCLRMCPITVEYNPVCGTDNVTYWNPGRLQCAILCGIDVAIKTPSVCSLDSDGSATTATTTLSPQVLATCMRSCPVTSEYNPICGTDNITYNNPSRLECAKSCGKPVSMLLPSRCPPPGLLPSTTSTTTATTVSPQVLATCMRSCPITSEYNPVCGTDNITYNNPSSLECVKGCGKTVSILLPSRCPSPGQLISTTTRTTSRTNTVSSTTTTRMTPTSTPLRPTSLNLASTSAEPATKFTIAQNILDTIFNDVTTTTESVPDFSLDERHDE